MPRKGPWFAQPGSQKGYTAVISASSWPWAGEYINQGTMSLLNGGATAYLLGILESKCGAGRGKNWLDMLVRERNKRGCGILRKKQATALQPGSPAMKWYHSYELNSHLNPWLWGRRYLAFLNLSLISYGMEVIRMIIPTNWIVVRIKQACMHERD